MVRDFRRLVSAATVAAVLSGGGAGGGAAARADPIFLDPITAGTGGSHAFVQVDFKDGATYLFESFFDGTPTGQDLINELAADVPGFTLTTIHFDFGDVIDTISYDGHADSGFDVDSTGFWDYWNRDDQTQPWIESEVGAGGREVLDGNWDAWAWDEGFEFPGPTPRDVEIPEPASVAVVLFGVGVLLRRRRRS